MISYTLSPFFPPSTIKGGCYAVFIQEEVETEWSQSWEGVGPFT